MNLNLYLLLCIKKKSLQIDKDLNIKLDSLTLIEEKVRNMLELISTGKELLKGPLLDRC